MRSNIKRKNYNLILVLIFVFNLVTQAALPAVAFATEVDSVTDDVTGDLPATGSSIILPLIGGTSLILSGLGTELYRRKRFMK